MLSIKLLYFFITNKIKCKIIWTLWTAILLKIMGSQSNKIILCHHNIKLHLKLFNNNFNKIFNNLRTNMWMETISKINSTATILSTWKNIYLLIIQLSILKILNNKSMIQEIQLLFKYSLKETIFKKRWKVHRINW